MDMKPSDVFGVVVRSLGLVFILYSLWMFLWAFINLIGGGPSNILEMIIAGIPTLFIGVWFLSGAESLISWAYAKEELEKGN
jgi:hypothetical protein